MATTAEQQREALDRAQNGQSVANYQAIYDGFAEKGIYDAEPSQNVFTYHAWRQLGRQVRKGQHGVKICTYVECKTKERDPETGERGKFLRKKMTTVFHKSQTDPMQ